MPLENYVLLAPGFIVGRLSVEPWLAIPGIVIGVWARPWWLVALVAALSGALWGVASYYIAGDAMGGPILEWAYLGALPVFAVALASRGIVQLIRRRTRD